MTERSEQLSAAYEELQAKEAHLRQVSSEAVMLQERERRAVARELHDGVGQALTAIRINLQLIEDGSGEQSQTRRLAKKTVALVDQALEEVRRAVALLGPAILDEIGLAAAVERQCIDFAERTGIEVQRRVETAGKTLSPAVESTCYRVVQEGLTNVVKHAGAERVTVNLDVSDEAVSLAIGDDGRGFDPEQASAAGRGLAGIRERVYLLGGTLDVDSSRDRGTVVRVELPARPKPGERIENESVS